MSKKYDYAYNHGKLRGALMMLINAVETKDRTLIEIQTDAARQLLKEIEREQTESGS